MQLVAQEYAISWWIAPPADGEPKAPLGTLVLPTFGVGAVRVYAEQAWAIGDLRIGRTWEEVVPLP